MTGTELVALVKERTGRLDLSDVEILRGINRACRLLDNIENSEGRTFEFLIALAAAEYIHALPAEFRVATKVSIQDSDSKTELSYVSPARFKSLVNEEASMLDGIYTIMTGATSADYTTQNVPTFTDVLEVQAIPKDRKLYIGVYPKPTVAKTLEIEATAFSTIIDGTNTSNYWSLYYPDLIVQALSYLLVKDLLNIDHSTKIYQDLVATVRPITEDFYQQESISEMGG